jgi:hypothetical protein
MTSPSRPAKIDSYALSEICDPFNQKLGIQTSSFVEREVWPRLEFVPRLLAIQTSNPPSARMNPSDCLGVLSTQEKPSCTINIFILSMSRIKWYVVCLTMSLPASTHGIEVLVISHSQLSWQHLSDHRESSLS